MTVSRIKMAANGPEVSRIISGPMRLNRLETSIDERLEWIEKCIEMGITTFDHADVYGPYTSEALFGEALKAKPSLREQIEIVTKCDIMLVSPHRPHINIHHYDTSREHILASVDQSLKNFHTDYLDVLLIHRPDALMDADEVASAFASLESSGKVRHFGVSNFSTSQFALLQSRLDMPLVTNQLEFSVMHMDALYDGTLDQAQQLRFSPMAWSPMTRGQVFRDDAEQAKRLRHTLGEISHEIGANSIDQVMVAWILKHPSKMTVVMGTTKVDRLKSASEATALEMSREQWYRIWSASTGTSVP